MQHVISDLVSRFEHGRLLATGTDSDADGHGSGSGNVGAQPLRSKPEASITPRCS